MTLWVKTLSEDTILLGHALNYCPIVPSALAFSNNEIYTLRDNGHSLLIGSIFSGVTVRTSEGKITERTVNIPKIINYLRDIIKSGISFKIIGNQEDLDILRKNSPPLYDKLMKDNHIVWKARKNKQRENNTGDIVSEKV